MRKSLAMVAIVVGATVLMGAVALAWSNTGRSQDVQGDRLQVMVWGVSWHLPGPEHNESGQFVIEVAFDINNDGTYEQTNTSGLIERINDKIGAFPSIYFFNLTLPEKVAKTITFQVQLFNVTNGGRIPMDFGSDGIIMANTTTHSMDFFSFDERNPPDPSLNTCNVLVTYIVDPAD